MDPHLHLGRAGMRNIVLLVIPSGGAMYVITVAVSMVLQGGKGLSVSNQRLRLATSRAPHLIWLHVTEQTRTR
jgi:hypothetical protein